MTASCAHSATFVTRFPCRGRRRLPRDDPGPYHGRGPTARCARARSDEELSFPKTSSACTRSRRPWGVRVRQRRPGTGAARRRARSMPPGRESGHVDALVRTRGGGRGRRELKIVCENFLECYHCQLAHRLAEVSTCPRVRAATEGRLEPARPGKESGNTNARRRRALRAVPLPWPNLTVNIFRGRTSRSAWSSAHADRRTASSTTSSAPTSLDGSRADGVRRPGRARGKVPSRAFSRASRPGGRPRLDGAHRAAIGHFQQLTAPRSSELLEFGAPRYICSLHKAQSI